MKASRPEIALEQDFPATEAANPGVQRDIRARTRLAFERLPPKLRVAAALALIEEQPYQEIADALGVSVGAVKLRVFRATRLLRKELKNMGIEP